MKIPTSYKVTALWTGWLLVMAALRGEYVLSPLVLVLAAPFLVRSPRWKVRAYGLSVLVFTGLAVGMFVTMLMVLAGMKDLSGFEGPNGEGAPIGPLIGMFMAAILFVIPWALVFSVSLRMMLNHRRSA